QDEKAIDIYNDAGDRSGIEGRFPNANMIDHSIHRLLVAGLDSIHQTTARDTPCQLSKDTPPQIYRCKGIRVCKQHLSTSQYEEAIVVQTEMKAGQDAVLRLRIEIHERVAADQQINARDGRILQKIMPAKDDRAPQVFIEDEAARYRVKILFQQSL